MPSRLGPLGSLPIPFFMCILWPRVGGTLDVFLLSREGFSELASFAADAVIGARPRWPTLSAAMRACMDWTWGPSSAIALA